MKTAPTSQRGAAFIYVALIFAAAAVIAAGLLGSGQMELRRTESFIDDEQAIHYAYGAEIYARQLLYADMIDHGQADYPGEAWGGKQSLFTIPGGNLEMDIEDLRGRFNVNGLLSGEQAAEDHFTALGSELGIAGNELETVLAHFRQLASAAADDPKAPPPRWLADTSELVDEGLPIRSYRILAPYLAALPDRSYAININTASDAVLRAYLGEEIDVSDIHDAIREKGHIDADKFDQLGIHDKTVGIASDAFMAHIAVHLNGGATRLNSTFLRRNGTKTVLVSARSWGK